jgi:hypothetical protein
MAEEEKMNIEDEESLEDIVNVESDDELLQNVAVTESVNVGEASLVEQLAGSLPMGTTRMIESSDVEQEQGGEMLEDVLRREWRPEDEDKKVSGDFYSGKKEDDDAAVYVAVDNNKPVVQDIAGSYSAAHAAGEVYQGGSQDFYNVDSAVEEAKRVGDCDRLHEVSGLELPSLDAPGAIKKKDLKYQANTY